MVNNWLDILFLLVIGVSLVLGLIKGLTRMIIGIASVVAGFIIAALYYRPVSALFNRLLTAEIWRHLIAFVLIFIAVVIVGGLVSFLLSKIIKGPLRFADRILGSTLGVITGVLICGVMVIAQLAFPVDKQALRDSAIAPYCYWLTKGMIQVIPQELKEKFKATYEEITTGPRDFNEKI
ncbi:MAG: CvpA family protein [Candidatus Aminicenantes bacterium]|nr:CvpA family protein [Candidatus Aminicenantes bacterium]